MLVKKGKKQATEEEDENSEGSVSVGLSCFSEFTAFGHVSQVERQVASQIRKKKQESQTQKFTRRDLSQNSVINSDLSQKPKYKKAAQQKDGKENLFQTTSINPKPQGANTYKNRASLTPIPASQNDQRPSNRGQMEEERLPRSKLVEFSRPSFSQEQNPRNQPCLNARTSGSRMSRRKKCLDSSSDEYLPSKVEKQRLKGKSQNKLKK